MLHDLSHYGLSGERGFLSAHEIDDVELPAAFAPVQAAADRLSAMMTTGNIRNFLKDMPLPDIEAFVASAAKPQLVTAMVLYSFLVQAYVWGEDAPPTSLPANLAVPIEALTRANGQPPLMPYSAYVLDNWYRFDKSGPITLENIGMKQNFFGGMDENWFVLVHVAIEAEAGRALELAVDLVRSAEAGDAAAVEAQLTEMNEVWDRVNTHFDRMTERCDPYIYFNRVRPYIHGWKNNPAMPEGLIYEGVDAFEGKPQAFRGQTGSQSSIVPAMDGLFQVVHQSDPLREFLEELHAYRPADHRRFIEDVAASSSLRDFAKGQTDSLKAAFNACVEQVARFRTRHLEYAASYINKQASSSAGNDSDVGTGGTPFMKYLKKHRDENRAQTI